MQARTSGLADSVIQKQHQQQLQHQQRVPVMSIPAAAAFVDKVAQQVCDCTDLQMQVLFTFATYEPGSSQNLKLCCYK